MPQSLEELLAEISHLKTMADQTKHILLFRGHAQRDWRIDSTFIRAVKAQLLGMSPTDRFSEHLRNSGDLNSMLSSLLLVKFGGLARPSAELHTVAIDHGVDPWFELMKRYQQYPNEDMKELKGTNLIDWSNSLDVALYFANENRRGPGAIFVCDATATGKTLQVIPVAEILSKIRTQLRTDVANGSPLLFSPKKQIAYTRAKNQQAVYFAQMDLRVDLLESWRLQEATQKDEAILIKLVLPAGSESALDTYLAKSGTNRTLIYPDGEA